MTKSLPEYLNNVVQCTRSLREVLRQAAALAVWAAPLGALADVLARVWPWPLRRPLVGLDDMEHAVGQVCDAVNSLTDAVREVLGGIPDHLTDQERVVVIAEVIKRVGWLPAAAAPGGSGAARRVRGSLMGLSAAGKWSA